MKTKIGVAVLLGLVAASLFVSPVGAATCPSPVLIKFDSLSYAYESNWANNVSSPGSQLTVVAQIVCFGPPLAYLNANMPAKEYTFIWTATSLGTATSTAGGFNFWDTNYNPGTFAIFEDNTPDLLASAPPNPPNASIPNTFVDGTVILSGPLTALQTHVKQRITTGVWSGNFAANYEFTGGTLYGSVPHLVQNIGNTWCSLGAGSGQCTLAAGYSAHPTGVWNLDPATASMHSTWGRLKTIYR